MHIVSEYPDGVFCWVDLTTPDVAGAKAFYGGLFGWSFDDIPTDESGSYVYSMCQINGHQVAGLGPTLPDMAGTPAYWASYVKHSNVDAIAERVTAAGGSLMFPPMDVMDSGRMLMGTDPTGAVFGAWQPHNHTGAQLVNVPNALAWNELQTRDADTARAFYTKVFDWTHKVGTHDYGLFYAGERMHAGLMQMDENWDASIPANWAVYFLVEDVAATVEKARSLGANLLVPPMDIEGTGTFATLQDPQGGVFSVIRFEGEADPPPGA